MRILVVEDTDDLADAVVHRLRKLGYAVDRAATGDEAQELMRQESYQLILLDIMLPGVDGQELLRRLRRGRDATPVLVMTARSQVDVKVDLLDIGADDFIVKPFNMRELEARCRALLRRSCGMASSLAQFGNLTFDAATKKVLVNERPVELSGREFRLLELFLGRLNAVMSKEFLMDRLFSLDQATTPNAIELYVSRLRRKLDDASVQIRTIRGMGYVAEIIDRA